MKRRKILWKSCVLLLCLCGGWQTLVRPNGIRPQSSGARPYVQGAGKLLPGGLVGLEPRKAGAGPVLARKPVVSYARLPLSFEANQGQTDKTVRFLSRGRGYGLFLTGDEAVLELQDSGFRSHDSGDPFGGVLGLQRATDNGPRTRANGRRTTNNILRLKLLNANQTATVTGAHELPGKVNYLLGNDPKKWRTNVPTYAEVRYRNVYPGIDLVYYGNQGGQLEYDFVVAPGADPSSILLAIDTSGYVIRKQRAAGNGQSKIDSNGDLVVHMNGEDEVRFHNPLVYQPDAGSTLVSRYSPLVEAHYVLTVSHQVRFALGPYDPTKPLIIDPTLTYSTYPGGSGPDAGYHIAVDSSGSAYVTGYTTSPDFPMLTPFQSTNKSTGGTAFVAKLNAAGSALVYSTYLGGSVSEQGNAIAVDSSGSAYVAGSTCSSDFPTVYPLQASLKGACDGFVAKLNATGSGLVYSTYLGGSGSVASGATYNDMAVGIAVDTSRHAYVTGTTYSSDFPTVNPLQATLLGSASAFLSKLDTSGSTLVYSTYLVGGSGASIAVDSSGNAYATGTAGASTYPTGNLLLGPGGDHDVFVCKVNAAGSAFVYFTYLGGSLSDFGSAIAVDSSGNAYVTGQTGSSDFPLVNPVQSTLKCQFPGDAFVAKLNAAGSALIYSTYLGGSGRGQCTILENVNGDGGTGIAADSSGNAYVTGWTYSTDFPTVSPIQANNNSACGTTAFVASLNAAGTALAYSTYLGGSGCLDWGRGIAVDASGSAYVTGWTQSRDFPTVNPLQPSNNTGSGDSTAFVAMISSSPPLTLSTASLDFGNVIANTTSPEKTVTVTNVSGASISLTSITANSDFALMATPTSCPYSGGQVAAGTTCPIFVTFTPTATNTRTGTLTVTYTGQGSPQTVALSGTGIVAAANVSPNSLSFSGQNVGTSSAPQTVTLTNPGSVALSVSNVAISSGWTQGNDCLPSVAANFSCTVEISFQPTALGPQTGSLTVTDYAGNSPQTVNLSGTGLAPAVSLSATTLSFAGQEVTTTSSPQTLTLTNTGTGTLIPLIVTVSGDFAQSNTCAGSVAAGNSCTINVTFTPNATGTRNGTLKLTDNASDSPQTASLTGTGEDFTLAVPNGYSSSATVPAGQAATYTLTVVGEGGFNQPVALACGGYPTESTCVVSPNSVVPGNNFSVIITTTATTAHAPPTLPLPHFPRPHVLLVPAALLACLAWAIRASRRGKASRWALYLPLGAGLLLVLALAGCGGSPAITQYGTPAGSYTVTLTGTAGAGSAAVSHTLKLTLNVS